MVTASTDTSNWKLCFLSGPMAGRSLSLPLGENWVGTGVDCEVILPDREIAARQLCLQVGSIAMSIQNFGGAPVTFNGAQLANARRTLVPGDTVTVGSIKFGVEHGAAMPAQPAAGGSAGAHSAGKRPAWLAAAIPAWLGTFGSRRLLFTLLALWSAFALAAGGYVAVATHGAFWWSHQSRFERMRELETALRGYPELTVAPGSGNVKGNDIVVSGYVQDTSDRARAAAIIKGFDNASPGDIFVVNELIATTQQTLSDTELKATYSGHGRMTITGIANRSIWQRMQNFKRDAKPAIEVVDRVEYDNNADGSLINANGTFTPADIAGIYGDDSGTRYLVTRDGRHFFEGATLPNGSVVASIEPDRIIFERNGNRYAVSISPHSAANPAPPAVEAPAATVSEIPHS